MWSVESLEQATIHAKCHVYGCCIRDEAEARIFARRVFLERPYENELAIVDSGKISRVVKREQ